MKLLIISCLLIASTMAQTGYQLVENGKGCGDSTLIELSDVTSDPQQCADLVSEHPLCDEYFEIRTDKAGCQCNPKGHICDFDANININLYKRDIDSASGCEGKITMTKECENCKCNGVNQISIGTHGYSGKAISEYSCAADAYESGARYMSFRYDSRAGDNTCIYGGHLSSAQNCEYNIVRNTKYRWAIYSLSCSENECSGDLNSVQVCEGCKCDGSSKFTQKKEFKTQKECQYEAFSRGHRYYSWRDNRNLCVFGHTFSSDAACVDNRITNAHEEWGIYHVTCESPSPTSAPTPSPTGIPDHVTDCGDGWFSKLDPPLVDAAQICMAMGYGSIDKWGGNSGSLCSQTDNGHGNCCWQCGMNCGQTVDFHCTGTYDESTATTTEAVPGIPDHVINCGEGWFSLISAPFVDAAQICMAAGYGSIDKWGGNSGMLCSQADNMGGNCGWDSGMNCGQTVDFHCTGTYDGP